MKFIYSIALVALFPFTVKAITLSIDTFAQGGCNDYQENIYITQSGDNANNFPGTRESFQVEATSNSCSFYTYEGYDQQGNSFDWGVMTDGECYTFVDDGEAVQWLSFDAVCS